MALFSFFAPVRQIPGSLGQILLQPVRRWTDPDSHAPGPNRALDLTRSKSEHMLEDALVLAENPCGGRKPHPSEHCGLSRRSVVES